MTPYSLRISLWHMAPKRFKYAYDMWHPTLCGSPYGTWRLHFFQTPYDMTPYSLWISLWHMEPPFFESPYDIWHPTHCRSSYGSWWLRYLKPSVIYGTMHFVDLLMTHDGLPNSESFLIHCFLFFWISLW